MADSGGLGSKGMRNNPAKTNWYVDTYYAKIKFIKITKLFELTNIKNQ